MPVDQELSALATVASLLPTDIIYLVRDPGGVAEADNKAAVSVIDARYASAAQGALAATALQAAAIGVTVQAYDASLLTDAPSDGSQYARQNAAWVVVAAGGSSLPVVDETAIVYKTGNVAITQTHDINAYTAARVVTWPNAALTVAGLEVANTFTAAQIVQGPTASTIPLIVKTTDNSTTNSLLEIRSSANARLAYINGQGKFGIGSQAATGDTPETVVNIRETVTHTSGFKYGVLNILDFGGLSNSSGSIIGGWYQASTRNISTGNLTSGGTMPGLVSGYFNIAHSTTNNTTVTLAANIFSIGTVASGATITTFRHLWAENATGAGTIATQTGLHIASLSKGTANYAIVSAGISNSGFGITAPAALMHLNQSSTTAAKPVLWLNQTDLSEEFIRFESTVGAGNSIEAIGAKTLTTTHFIRVYIEGVGARYMPVGTIA